VGKRPPMALLRRLLILGAAGAGVAWFLKKQRESAGQPVSATDVGDAAAAGTGTSETLQEAGAEQPEPPAPDSPAEDAGAGEVSAPSQPTRVGNPVVPDTSADPTVRREENAAAAEAGAIGGEPETPLSRDNPGLAQDPAMRPVVEGSGEEFETLEETDRDLEAGRERPGADRPE
jgi:hypothetical protein